MNPTLETFASYFARVAPGLLLGALMLLLARHQPRLRIVIYLALFVLLRDAMTPLGLWSFGTEGFFWIRLARDPVFLVVFGLACAAISVGLYYLDRENRPLFKWTRGSVPVGLAWGLAGALVVVAPLVVVYRFTDINSRGGPVPVELLPALLLFALLGNLLEEALFRGYAYGHLAERMPPIKAGIASGVVFAFCHIYLALTVTAAGYPILLFTLWEGIIAGLVGAKGGVLPSTLTHGGAIFLLSSGLF
jgi:membrane protease YdiL (CAAX protease family)